MSTLPSETLDEWERLAHIFKVSDGAGACPFSTQLVLIDEVRQLTDRAEKAERELERWRHGAPIEGDYVCPNSLLVDEARAEVEHVKMLCTDMVQERDEALKMEAEARGLWKQRERERDQYRETATTFARRLDALGYRPGDLPEVES